MSPSITKKRREAGDILNFLTVPGVTNRTASMYARMARFAIPYNIPEEVVARLAPRNITLDCAIELGFALVDEHLSEKEVFSDIIPAMEHIAAGGEPIQELQEALIP